MEVTYNKTKLQAFKESSLCPQQYKQLDIDQLYDAMLLAEFALVSYNIFLYVRWFAEKNRRSKQFDLINNRTSSEYLMKMKSRQQAIDLLKTKAILSASSKPTLLAGKNYKDLFKDEIDDTQWNDIELLIRKMFLSELEKEKAKGGCSNCARNGLIRKYIKKIQDLLK